MSQSRIVKGDFTLLNNFARGMSKDYAVRVGIFGNKSSRKGEGHITNPELGAIHEFGTKDGRIPPRSFLRMPIEKEAKKIVASTINASLKDMAHGKIRTVLVKLGIACENAVQRAFSTHGFGNWPPDAPSTIAGKKSSSPLIDTGQLRRSITSKVVS